MPLLIASSLFASWIFGLSVLIVVTGLQRMHYGNVAHDLRNKLKVLEYENRHCATHADFQDLLRGHEALRAARETLRLDVLRLKLNESQAHNDRILEKYLRGRAEENERQKASMKERCPPLSPEATSSSSASVL